MRARSFTTRAILVLAAATAALPLRAGPPEDTVKAEASIQAGDIITAMALLKKASDAGYAPAQARLADLLDLAEHDTEAVELYRKAVAQNDPAGELGLGRMYANGEGVAKDPVQALALIRRAAEKEHLPALEYLARAYRAGDLGLTRNLEESARLEARAKALRDAAKKAAR